MVTWRSTFTASKYLLCKIQCLAHISEVSLFVEVRNKWRDGVATLYYFIFWLLLVDVEMFADASCDMKWLKGTEIGSRCRREGKGGMHAAELVDLRGSWWERRISYRTPGKDNGISRSCRRSLLFAVDTMKWFRWRGQQCHKMFLFSFFLDTILFTLFDITYHKHWVHGKHSTIDRDSPFHISLIVYSSNSYQSIFLLSSTETEKFHKSLPRKHIPQTMIKVLTV